MRFSEAWVDRWPQLSAGNETRYLFSPSDRTDFKVQSSNYFQLTTVGFPDGSQVAAQLVSWIKSLEGSWESPTGMSGLCWRSFYPDEKKTRTCRWRAEFTSHRRASIIHSQAGVTASALWPLPCFSVHLPRSIFHRAHRMKEHTETCVGVKLGRWSRISWGLQAGASVPDQSWDSSPFLKA